ncbi:MAG: S41 family peptidase [Methylococcaceae bacterium]
MKWFLTIALVFITVTAGVCLWYEDSSDFIIKKPISPEKDFWSENDDILIYLEAITRIKNHALYLDSEIKRKAIIQESLKSYVEKADRFAAYLTADEFKKWKGAQGDQYVGIGMEIEKDRGGQIVCLPYPGSPAEQAGIRAGDRLISIDGVPVRDRSILAIGTMARGEQGTRVKLVITSTGEETRQISISRSAVSLANVTISDSENIPVIKILAFTRDTKLKLENALTNIDKNSPLVIDLRGNAGGDLFAAIDSAKLFLDDHKQIVSIKTRLGIEKYQSGDFAVNTSSPLFLWQDEGTASAAEVFIAALTSNKRAVSIGKQSFGKGTKQEVFELSDGSALFITNGYLQTPDAIFFDGKGLNPDYPVESPKPKTLDFLVKVNELLKTRK